MLQIALWLAPIATALAAMMTAANLGPRVTGYGFVVFLIGSIAWSYQGWTTDQSGLLASNAWLSLVNLVGIWRWLGREARYKRGSDRAASRSAIRSTPTLVSIGKLSGLPIAGSDGRPLGSLVDAMLCVEDRTLSYVVLGTGGLGGLGERLLKVDPDRLDFRADGIGSDLTPDDLEELDQVPAENWPAEADPHERA